MIIPALWTLLTRNLFQMYADSIGPYIAQGADSVVLSDAIFNKEAMHQKDFNKIFQLARIAAMCGKEAVEK